MADDEDIDLGLGDEPVRLHPILTNEEVLDAKKAARDKIMAERRIAAKKAVEKDEIARLRRVEGLTTGVGLKDEIVNITLDLPPYAKEIVINFDTFEHAHTYAVPRHLADTLAEMQDRMWKHEDEVKGRSMREHYGVARRTIINGVTGATSQAPTTVFQ